MPTGKTSNCIKKKGKNQLWENLVGRCKEQNYKKKK